MAVGCHRQLAQHGTSCCAVTGASSAALRGGERRERERERERERLRERERGERERDPTV